MNRRSWARWLESFSDNLKSKIENRKWAGLFAIVLALTLVGARAEAQQPKKVHRIGYLSSSDPASDSPRLEAIRLALPDLGYIEGQNIASEYRFAEGKNDRLPELAADLVRLKIDLIVGLRGTSGGGSEGSNHYHSYRDNGQRGPRGVRFDCQFGAAGRQCHGALEFNVRTKLQKARDTQGCDP
jgi:hypothetical protein